MGKALGLSEADTLAAKQGGTGLDRAVNLDGTQAIPGAPKGQAKRGFVKSLQEDWGVPSKVSDQLPQGYKQIKNADTFAQAKQIVDSDPASLQRLLRKETIRQRHCGEDFHSKLRIYQSLVCGTFEKTSVHVKSVDKI